MKKNGFTLVELIVAITIIALLTAAAIVSYAETTKRSRDAKRLSDMETVRSALEICRSQTGEYPDSVISGGAVTCSDGTVTLKIVPSDPKAADGYAYVYSQATTTYNLRCTLEKITSCTGTIDDTSCVFKEP